ITGKGYAYKELEQSVDFLKRELLMVPDVAKIELVGVQPQQIYLEITRERLAQLGISLEQISQTLKEQNLIISAGNVKVGKEYIRILPTGQFTSVEQIGDLLIKGTIPGRLIYLRDVGKIFETYLTPPNLLVNFDGQPAYVIAISIKPGGNIVKMGSDIKAK